MKFSSPDKIVPLATAAVKIVENNPNRIALIMSNTDTVNGFVSPSNQVITTRGILLQSNGGFLALNTRDDGPLPSRAWFGISSATPSILVIEIIKVSNDKDDKDSS